MCDKLPRARNESDASMARARRRTRGTASVVGSDRRRRKRDDRRGVTVAISY